MINIYLFIVTCDATRFCCENGTSGCEGRCMSLGVVDDGKPDCDNGSDEEVTLAEGNQFTYINYYVYAASGQRYF